MENTVPFRRLENQKKRADGEVFKVVRDPPLKIMCKKSAFLATISNMRCREHKGDAKPSREELYREIAGSFEAPLQRLARAYEANAENRKDLLQEIHLALWRSLKGYDRRCSVRTWVYRVAHNTATSHVLRQRRVARKFVTLEEIESAPDESSGEDAAIRRDALQRLLALIRRLKPIDRQIMLSYLEGMDGASIGEITGITPGNAATRVHRIKKILARRFQDGCSS